MADKFIQVDGLKIRYLQEGKGPEVILLHGASQGSSADVWERNMGPLARQGFGIIAYDQPGFGLSDNPKDYSVAYRRRFILKLLDALEIQKASLVGHSQAGSMSVSLAFEHPERIFKIVVLGTGTLLPPCPRAKKRPAPEREKRALARSPPSRIREPCWNLTSLTTR